MKIEIMKGVPCYNYVLRVSHKECFAEFITEILGDKKDEVPVTLKGLQENYQRVMFEFPEISRSIRKIMEIIDEYKDRGILSEVAARYEEIEKDNKCYKHLWFDCKINDQALSILYNELNKFPFSGITRYVIYPETSDEIFAISITDRRAEEIMNKIWKRLEKIGAVEAEGTII